MCAPAPTVGPAPDPCGRGKPRTVEIHTEDDHRDLLTHLHCLRGVLEALRGKVDDGHQPKARAEVHVHTEVGNTGSTVPLTQLRKRSTKDEIQATTPPHAYGQAMTLGGNTADLVNLSDGDNIFRVRVLRRRSPGILPTHDLLDAEAVVATSFISGHLSICFYPSDLEAWALVLDALDAGRNSDWLDTGNGPLIRISFSDGDPALLIVQVEDTSGSGASAAIPIAVDDAWIEEQRARLLEVLLAWPSEVRETSPGAYEWRR